MLRIESISKTFFPGTINERQALVDSNLHLKQGDFVTIIGSNGAGKSTLLNSVAGRLPVDGGTITIGDVEVNKLKEYQRAKYVGRVFQDPLAGTAPDLTIEENLALALRRGQPRGLGRGVTKARRERFIGELRSLDLGLESRLKARVGLLSGGQRQALSLLMAAFTHPKILLLDEHTAALDPQRAELVSNLTNQIVTSEGLTTLMVTHNMEQAIKLGNRLIMMHEGRIIFEASEEEKATLTVGQLLHEFTKTKGAALDDRSLLT